MLSLKNQSHTRNKTIIFVTITLFIFSIVLLGTIYYNQKNKLSELEKKFYNNIKTTYGKVLQEHQSFYSYRLKNAVEMQGVKEALYNKDRKKLYALVKPFFKTLQEESSYVKLMHFHLPNGESFLRLHKPNKYGDNIAQKRPMAAAVHQKQCSLNGFEAGIFMLAYREFLPIFHNGKYIGAVEIGSRPDQVLSQTDYLIGVKGALFVKENKIIEYSEKDTFKIDDFRLQYNTLKEKELVKLLPKDYDFKEHIQIPYKDKTYIVYPFDMLDYDNKLSAKVVYFHDITSMVDAFKTTVKQLVVLLVGLLGILVLVISVGFSKIIDVIEKVNEELQEQKDELEAIFQTSKDGIAILDATDTKFLFFNESYLKMTGYTKEELLEKKCAQMSVKEDIQKAIQALEVVLEKGFLENFEKGCVRKDGSVIKVNMSLALMPDKKRILVAAKDITELKRKEKLINDYVRLIDENIITSSTDLDGNITYVSNAFCKISGYSKAELLGQNHRIIRHPDIDESLYEQMWETVQKSKIWQGEIKNRKKDGDAYWVKASIYPTYDENGIKTGYTAIRQDITDKKRVEEISITDGLTNIHNRRYFNETFPKAINVAKRKNEMLCFLIMDIDHFKQYNDTYGHQKGDEVLIKVAQAIKESINRGDDYCFRLGGEEFGVLFKAQSKQKAVFLAEAIKQNIENLHIQHEKNSASSYITASMGLVCQYGADIVSMDEIYKEADEMLYKAKESGRNKVFTL